MPATEVPCPIYGVSFAFLNCTMSRPWFKVHRSAIIAGLSRALQTHSLEGPVHIPSVGPTSHVFMYHFTKSFFMLASACFLDFQPLPNPSSYLDLMFWTERCTIFISDQRVIENEEVLRSRPYSGIASSLSLPIMSKHLYADKTCVFV